MSFFSDWKLLSRADSRELSRFSQIAGKLAGNFFSSGSESPIYAQIPQFSFPSRELAGNLQGISKSDPKSLKSKGLIEEQWISPT
jgi:hypothetical protein